MKGILFHILAVAACAVAYPNMNYNPNYEGPDMNLFSSYDNQQRSSLIDDSEYDPNSRVVLPDDPAANFNPFTYPPLATFIERIQGMMRRVQTQMGNVLSKLPPQEIDWSKLGNTTSHTKIVNDHVVTVNETTYKNPDDALGAVLHIRVVDMKPTTASSNVSPPIIESEDKVTSNVEKRQNSRASIVHRYFPNGQTIKRQYPEEKARLSHMYLENVDNAVDVFQPIQPIDLSRDTLVNDLRRDETKGGLVMVDPNAELIDVVDGQVRPSFHYRQPRNNFHQQRTKPVFNWNRNY